MRSNVIRSRSGFTLIEILVVLAIIAILGALTVGAVIQVTKGSRLSNTRSVMGTIDKTLREHWAHVVAEASKETGLDVPFATMNNFALFGPDATGGARNKIIWIKLRLMEAFPTSFAEIASPYPYTTGIIPPALRKYNGTYQSALASRNAANTKPATESAACLQIALSVARNGTTLSADSLGSSYVTDTDADNIKELVDGWGNPLGFFRFPTKNATLQALKPVKAGTKANWPDPLDPEGLLLKWGASIQKTRFLQNVHNHFSGASAAYIVPSVVSAGQDGLMGLDTTIANNMFIFPKMAPKAEPDAADNVYSFEVK